MPRRERSPPQIEMALPVVVRKGNHSDQVVIPGRRHLPGKEVCLLGEIVEAELDPIIVTILDRMGQRGIPEQMLTRLVNIEG